MSILEEIELMCQLTDAKNIYYQTSAHLPKLDRTGQENFSKMKVDNVLEVWLLPPDLLPQFEQIVHKTGKNAVEFDLAEYLNLPHPRLSTTLFIDQ
jgi:hypothetical protein